MTKTYNWQKIYSAYSPKLLGICRRYIQDIHTAEDIIQDSFITAIQKNHQLKDENAIFAWLKKIVVNNALQYLRTSNAHTFITTEPSEIPDTPSAMEHHLLEEKNAFIYDFTHQELLSSIDSLPPHHKSVFNLYFIENYSHAEISDVLGITVNTSKSHLLRAKKSIQNYLLNHVVNQNTPKKKTAQVLIFLGFGSLLWAQTFKAKFSDFSISPSRPFEIPESTGLQNNGHAPSFKTHSSQEFLRKVIIVGVGLFAVITASIFFLPQQTNSKFQNMIFTQNANVVEEEKRTDIEVHDHSSSVTDSESTQNEGISMEKKNLGTTEIQEQKNSSISLKNHHLKSKDSLLESTPQKVIVVKKIIQRDTIYVER